MDKNAADPVPSRAELDAMLAAHPVIGAEPRRDIYGRLRTHPDRFKLHGLRVEARVWAKSLLRNDTPTPFLIYGRPRSGTTLLVHLLNQIPGIRCDNELLHFFLLDPLGLLRRLPKRAGGAVQAYGVKVISYQLMEIQRIRKPLAFFDELGSYGYRIIHLKRNSWDQTLSLIKAQESGVYFSKSETDARTLQLDPERFLNLLRWNEMMLDYENEVMTRVAHLAISYDRSLKVPARHQETIDRVCSYLGVASRAVNGAMRRTGGAKGLQQVGNLEELAIRVGGSDLAHLVPDGLIA